LLDKDAKATQHGPRPASVLFALSSNLAVGGKTELARYDELRGNAVPPLSALCIVGRGYWWFDKDRFQQWPERYEYAEVMGFLGGIMNALPRLWETRRTSRPPLGAYMIDFGADISVVVQRTVQLRAKVTEVLQHGAEHDEALRLTGALRALTGEIGKIFAQYNEHPTPDKMTELKRLLEQDCAQMIAEIEQGQLRSQEPEQAKPQ
jgi:hypothetical protein